MRTFTRISKGGQVTIPAPVRKRWGTTRLVVEDDGDRLTIRPMPEDPIGVVIGSIDLGASHRRRSGPSCAKKRTKRSGASTDDDPRRSGAHRRHRGSTGGARVERILRQPERPRISAVNLAEVIDVLARKVGAPWPDVADAVERLRAGGLTVVAADEAITLFAGEIRARHCDRASDRLSLADCFALATAQTLGTELATSDPALARVARRAGTDVLTLPDVSGRRP